MELKNIFKRVPLALIALGITMFAMEQHTDNSAIKVITNDDQITEIPKNIALKSSVIKNFVQDLGTSDEPIPLPNISKAQLMPIIHILQWLDAADQSKLKRSDGAYIAQRIQPIIDQNLRGKCQQVAPVVHAAEYLDLGYIANGAIRTMIQKALSSNPYLTLDNLEIECFGNQKIPHNLNSILEYQYQLVQNGSNELSITDYIAINGMPTIKDGKLVLSRKHLTSLEGLTLIPGITNLQELSLNTNKLTTIPANAFNGLTNLRDLHLSDNKLTTIPATAFNGLTNLRDLYLNNNELTTISVGTFNGLTKLLRLSLSHNKLTTIPTGTFNSLTNLLHLYIQMNPITRTMSNDAFRNLYSIPERTIIY